MVLGKVASKAPDREKVASEAPGHKVSVHGGSLDEARDRRNERAVHVIHLDILGPRHSVYILLHEKAGETDDDEEGVMFDDHRKVGIRAQGQSRCLRPMRSIDRESAACHSLLQQGKTRH